MRDGAGGCGWVKGGGGGDDGALAVQGLPPGPCPPPPPPPPPPRPFPPSLLCLLSPLPPLSLPHQERLGRRPQQPEDGGRVGDDGQAHALGVVCLGEAQALQLHAARRLVVRAAGHVKHRQDLPSA